LEPIDIEAIPLSRGRSDRLLEAMAWPDQRRDRAARPDSSIEILIPGVPTRESRNNTGVGLDTTEVGSRSGTVEDNQKTDACGAARRSVLETE